MTVRMAVLTAINLPAPTPWNFDCRSMLRGSVFDRALCRHIASPPKRVRNVVRLNLQNAPFDTSHAIGVSVRTYGSRIRCRRKE